MPNPPRLSGVRTHGFTKKQPPSVSTGDNSRMTASRPDTTANSSQDLKHARFDLGSPGANTPHKEILHPPCRLCEELYNKTIITQRQDIRSLRADNEGLHERLQKIQKMQTPVHLLLAALLADQQGIAAALNSWQGKLQRLQAVLTSLLDQSSIHNAPSDIPQALGVEDPPWIQKQAPAIGTKTTTNIKTLDGDLFGLNHGNLFDLKQIPSINLDAADYQA